MVPPSASLSSPLISGHAESAAPSQPGNIREILLNRSVSVITGIDDTSRAPLRDRDLARRHYWDSLLANIASSCMPCVVVFILVLLVWTLYALFFYFFEGWSVLRVTSHDQCDQPLWTWLLVFQVAVTLVFLKDLRNRVLCCYRYDEGSMEEPPPRVLAFHRLLNSFSAFWFLYGYVMSRSSDTCANTAPLLFDFVLSFTGFILTFYGTMMGLLLLVLPLMVYLASRGVIGDRNRSARDDVIERMTVVDVSALLSAGTDPECPICYEKYSSGRPAVRTPCQHLYHKSCLGTWLKTNKFCPLCRVDLQESIDASSV